MWKSIKESNLNIPKEIIMFFENLLSAEFLNKLKLEIFSSKDNKDINLNLNIEKVKDSFIMLYNYYFIHVEIYSIFP